jgi:predicted nucleic acid-binding protein
MSVFVDTSALYAMLDADDADHQAAADVWTQLLEADEPLVSSNYILVETTALAQHRLGAAAARTLLDDVVPALTIEWVTPEDHRAAASALLAAGRRDLSLVDCVSFEVMRRLGIRRAFSFDRHFGDVGFELVP